MMFLDRLIARATGRLPVLKTAPALAAELEHPAYGLPVEAEVDGAEPRPPANAPARPATPAAATQTRPPVADAAPPAVQATATRPDMVAQADMAAPREPALTLAVAPAIEPPKPTAPTRPDQPTISAPVDPPARGAQTAPEPVATMTRAPITRDTAAAQPQPALPRSPQHEPAEARPMPVLQTAEPPNMPEPQPDAIEIHLDIGRIDLVSPQPARPKPAQPNRQARPAPHLNLTDYLDRRRGNR